MTFHLIHPLLMRVELCCSLFGDVRNGLNHSFPAQFINEVFYLGVSAL
jgi:hypothetical protein